MGGDHTNHCRYCAVELQGILRRFGNTLLNRKASRVKGNKLVVCPFTDIVNLRAALRLYAFDLKRESGDVGEVDMDGRQAKQCRASAEAVRDAVRTAHEVGVNNPKTRVELLSALTDAFLAADEAVAATGKCVFMARSPARIVTVDDIDRLEAALNTATIGEVEVDAK